MRLLIITLALVIISSISFADTIILKNGRRIKVDNIALEGNTLKCQILGGEMSFKVSDVAAIEKSESPRPKAISQKSNDAQPKISEARTLALQAYQHASDNPLNAKARAEALEILRQARAIDPNEAEIFLVETIMTLQDGYRHGPWYKASAYNGGVVDTAIYKVNNAINADPTYSKPYAILAWLYIVKSDFSRTEELLEKSYSLKQNNFYYWLYKGTLSQEKKEYAEAQKLYDTAGSYATKEGMRSLIRTRKRDLAKLTGNLDEAERLYIDEIHRDPGNAYSYGNYAGFLLCNGRFDESIPYYEKAISISPYPKVLLGLEFAKMKNEAAAKCKDNKVQI